MAISKVVQDSLNGGVAGTGPAFGAYDAAGNEVTYDLAAVQAYVDSQAYIAKRAAEYPPMSDYLDGVVKGDQQQIDAYIAACLEVKAKYPK